MNVADAGISAINATRKQRSLSMATMRAMGALMAAVPGGALIGTMIVAAFSGAALIGTTIATAISEDALFGITVTAIFIFVDQDIIVKFDPVEFPSGTLHSHKSRPLLVWGGDQI